MNLSSTRMFPTSSVRAMTTFRHATCTPAPQPRRQSEREGEGQTPGAWETTHTQHARLHRRPLTRETETRRESARQHGGERERERQRQARRWMLTDVAAVLRARLVAWMRRAVRSSRCEGRCARNWLTRENLDSISILPASFITPECQCFFFGLFFFLHATKPSGRCFYTGRTSEGKRAKQDSQVFLVVVVCNILPTFGFACVLSYYSLSLADRLLVFGSSLTIW